MHSARVVDDAAVGTSCVRVLTGGWAFDRRGRFVLDQAGENALRASVSLPGAPDADLLISHPVPVR